MMFCVGIVAMLEIQWDSNPIPKVVMSRLALYYFHKLGGIEY